MTRLADDREQAVRPDEPRLQIVLNFARDALLARPVAAGDEDLPVVADDLLERDARSVERQRRRIEPIDVRLDRRLHPGRRTRHQMVAAAAAGDVGERLAIA